MATANLEELAREARAAIEAADTAEALTQVRSRYLGKKGSVAQVLRSIGELPPEERGKLGAAANQAKVAIEALVEERREALTRESTEQTLTTHKLDVTLPGAGPPLGHIHPLTLVVRDMVSFFSSMGFSVEEGPQIETDWNNFEALNIPDDHPAKETSDTFYLEDGHLLRTQTSTVQIRVMTGRKPPFRFIAPGRVYRHDSSPRHSPMFNQIEGFIVDEQVRFSDLKGVLVAFGRHLFGPQCKLRFRANHFPFTEPSAELDYSCELCKQKGCKMCSYTGWVEWGGCGMIHPLVLERCGIDSEKYQGFAFGMGIDRTTSRRYGIPHLRHLFEGDLRVLEQI
jgi:phenylalanyl-tRNA synthetase alpha chain